MPTKRSKKAKGFQKAMDGFQKAMDVVASRIRALDLGESRGFGGDCLAAADAINEQVFDGQGRIVGAANAFWYRRDRFVGHVAVLCGGRYWDGDAEPKPWTSREGEDIESWGVLAVDDPDYFAEGWGEKAAETVVKLDEAEVRKVWRTS